MTVAALVLFGFYLGVGFVLRTLLQWRRTGDSGFRGISGRPGSAPWWAGVLFVVALVAGVAGPVAALLGLDALPYLQTDRLQIIGTVVAVAGLAGTFITQLDMGTSWRIGVDDAEKTELVTGGAFAVVRNPIFTAMAATGAGLALMVPNVVAVGGFVLLLVALQLQVRVVEEPYLRLTHGADYVRYARTTGRFLPGIGRYRVSTVASGLGEAAGTKVIEHSKNGAR
ncbi:methyltransferase family protein [Nocardioides caldifontis]|uniref:methyltransferase family protein n=1 Tax=Nocardioides caldifontis TaxID=2588938 RepID=UPI0011DF0E67|nr:isoprenylcysteine carboxylmethyltransferase family protein [Nocardioides caldifontis]